MFPAPADDLTKTDGTADRRDLLWNTVATDHNLARLLKSREVREDHGRTVRRKCHFTGPLLRRMDLDYNLEGHQGCVNCLQWSADGRRLASGSDDTHVRVWDPFANRCLRDVPTKHFGNIFSVKFVGDGSLIATGAGDCRVIVQSIENSEQQEHIDCTCHAGRVKRLATAPDQPLLFWSAGEDGLIIQYDLREQHECAKVNSVFVDLSYTIEFKCIAVNPTKPHLIAVGANDSYVRLYDRRMIKLSKVKPNHGIDTRKRTPEPQDPNCVQYFAPGHLAKDNGGDQGFKLVATYVAFDAAGERLLVNMGGEYVYLFDINGNGRHVNDVRLPDVGGRRPRPARSPPPPVVRPCCYDGQRRERGVAHEHDYRFAEQSPCVCDFMDRAARIYKRKWIGDVYFAARDYLHVVRHCPENEQAYLGLIDCLIQLKWPEEATEWMAHFQRRFPAYVDNRQMKKFREALDKKQSAPGSEPGEGSILEPLEVSDEEKALRLNSRDYESRYIGHCNTTTDIKEANFLGEDGNFICAGSDDGLIFIWDTKTTNLLTALAGDISIVNCVQPHPSICCLASSGIDPVVKIWSPKNEDVENYTNRHAVKDPWAALKANQNRMALNPFETMLANMGYRVRETSLLVDNQFTQRHYRKYILEYLKRLACNKELTYCTLHLTVYILDIFMDNHSITTERVLLVANVCLLIASKVEENNMSIPKICELNEAIDNRFPPHDYKALEVLVLQFFHWYMMFPTAAHYVYYFLHVALNLDDLRDGAESQDALYRRMQPVVRRYLDKIIDADVHYMQFYKPSKLASAVVSIARSAVGLSAWTEQLYVLTSYNDEEIEDARIALLE